MAGNDPKKFYAHSLPTRPPEEWQLQEDRLRFHGLMGVPRMRGGVDWSYERS